MVRREEAERVVEDRERSRVDEDELGAGVAEQYETVRASRRVLILLSTAPLIGTPNCASYMAGTFGSSTDTW